MNAIITLNQAAERWLSWVTNSLVDGCVALVIVALLWCLLGKRLRPRLGAWLFALVLLKCVAPAPWSVHLPLLANASAPLPVLVEEITAPFARVQVSPAVAASEIAKPDYHYATAPVSLTIGSWLLIAWASGVLVLSARLLWLWRRTQRLIGRARPVGIGQVPGLASLLEDSRGGRLPLRVRISGELHSPAIAGWWRPVLLLPEGLQEKLTSEQQRWVLAHEIAHLRSHDVAWQWLESLAQIFFPFHPAVWLASSQSARLRERACDEEAVRMSGTSRQQSAAGFVSLIEWSQKPIALAGLSLGSAGREARSRIRSLAEGPVRQLSSRWQWLAGLACLAMVLPTFRIGDAQAQDSSVADRSRIAELEQKVAALEQQLQSKSRLETLRENAARKTHQRVQADQHRFSAEEIRDIERLYQDARKGATAAELGAGFQPLFDRYPTANRTGCALLLLARLMQGTERQSLLHKAIKEHSDAFFLDGTSVGGVARLMLAQDAEAGGKVAEALRWQEEIRQSYAEDLDFGAVPLGDVLTTSAVRQ